MVLPMCLCVWRIFVVLFTLRAYEWPHLARADTHPDDASHHKVNGQLAVDGGQLLASGVQHPDAGDQHHLAKASQVKDHGGTDDNAGSPVDMTELNINPAIGKVSQEDAPTDNAPATDAQQAGADALNEQPSDNDISHGKKAQPGAIQSSSATHSSGKALSSKKMARQEARTVGEGRAEPVRPGGGTEGEEVQSETEESIIDEKTLGRRSVPKPVNIPIEDLLKAEMVMQRQVAFKEEDLDIPEGIRDNMQQEGSEEQKERARDAPSQEGTGDFQRSKEEEEADARTQQNAKETPPSSQAKVAQTGTLEGQEEGSKPPSKTERGEEDLQEAPSPAQPVEGEPSLASGGGEASPEREEASSERDPGSEPFEGAPDARDQGDDSTVSAATLSRDTLKEASPEDEGELPRDAEKADGASEKPEPVLEDEEAAGEKATLAGERQVGEEEGEVVPEAAEEKEKEKEEEMPSFDEWKQKMLEQHEQERQHGQAGQGVAVPPARPFSLTENSKNHASSDCGAKILNVNKEAQNAPAILQANRDVYTLNPCTANIWFTVELCEPIQVKHLEIANYELFSSVPESFRVSITDRFPTREWRPIGTFHAREERSLQSFPVLEEQMFAKYMKVEMLTFFGSEHYCPLSTLRVFGTSMVEEIDEEEIHVANGIQRQSEVLPEHPVPIPEEGDRSLLQSAKGLVRNLMNAITGNGQPAPPCENKNKSCTKVEEMLPCMPQDKPKMLPSQPSNQWMSPYLFQSSSIVSGFSLDPVHFGPACRGSTWCFSPNYGQTFQDCCVRGTAAFPNGLSHHRRGYLYCRDTLGVRLHPSPLEPSLIQKDSLIQKEPWERGQAEGSAAERDSNQRTKVRRVTLVGEGVESAGDVPSSPSLEAATQGSVKTTLVLTQKEVGTVHLPQPTPSHKSTCSTVPTDLPPTPTLAAPIHLQPSPTVAEPDPQLQAGGALYPAPEPVEVEGQKQQQQERKKEKEGGAQDGEVDSERPKPSKPQVQDPSGAALKDAAAEPGHPSPQAGKDAKDPKSKPSPPPQTSQTGVASKDSNATANVEPPDPTASSDLSRKADATAKEPDKVVVADEAGGRLARGEGQGKGDPASKAQEPAKQEAAGKGAKVVLPEAGSNGAGGLGSIAQKESVFMRLNNRIKSLELNMSLSSRYLEELSQRYRKQMDEMQKAFNKTIKTLTGNAQKAEEKDQKQQEYITRLEGQMSEVMIKVDTATQRLNGLHKEVIERHLFFLLVELLLMLIFFLVCRHRFRRAKLAAEASHLMATLRPEAGTSLRRNSLPLTPDRTGGGRSSSSGGSSSNNNRVLPQVTPTKRRKPEQTPARVRGVSGGSCDDLLIIGPSTPFLESLKQANESTRQRSKHKAKHKPPQKSISSSTLHGGRPPDVPAKRANKMTVAGLLFRGSAFRGGQTPPDTPLGGLPRTVSAENLHSLPGRVQEVKGPVAPSVRQQQQHPKNSGKSAARKHGSLINGRR